MTQPRLLGGRYELDGVVGRGGMAEVYRARDIRLDRVVAIKTLRSDLARDHTFQARFRREAQSAASLNHPSIVAVYDTGEDMTDGTPVPYIVMEFVDGRTLRDVLRADRRLMPERAAELVDGILRALDYSHRGGIVHRDIKPANVMITLAGDVKVMDFGIARAMADSAATMTQTAQVIGTAQYLSPEQARGERVDARSDIYSTGCVLYELLTGQPPFTGDSPVAIAYQHVREDPIPPSQIDPDIPQWADAIVLKAMAKDPAHRYQSAAEMRADIQRALSGMPVDAAQTMALSNNGYTGQQTRTLHSPGVGPATQHGNAVPPYEYAETQVGGGGGPGRYERRRASSGNTALKTAAWILVPLLVIGAFIGVGYAFLSSGGDKPETTTVSIPIVKGQTADAAQAKLTSLGLKVEIVEEFNSEVEKGTVIGSDPIAGEKVSSDTVVKLQVSKGVKQAAVPDVIGSTVDEATSTMEANKLNADVIYVVSAKEQGKVFQTKPAAGAKVDEGSIVKLYVPKAATPVPDVTGQTQQDATATLKGAGFKVRVVKQTSETVAEGTVISQSPPPGSKLTANTTITLVVSSGPPEQTFPTDEPTDVPTDQPTDEPTDPTTDDPFSDPPPDDFGN
ncbi:putative serine/threonine-protein kinase [Sphaerisporangium melleum]|uniref:non-specific serine/threonine protein kinase n=1 Tax=Sphaerisporangium melleum TaxID=321316 RepID=A0A917VLE0_9ACTN|nr:Stk1 family PASTA domain-containing Ser/Thr kinase [Sphaerisporangium melleum]GGK92528.1 putative serine/threonine-protein kinase [Sphaerisporangium melleum]GII73025.1 putative serine/threonine-protein kinase [Sphaerisporangium melleum]